MKALIIGVTGQDGSLLASHLCKEGIEVHGTFRRGSADNFWRLKELGIREAIQYHNYNIGNELAFSEILKMVEPELIFSLAGESFTALSFEEPKHFLNINIDSVIEQLESIKLYAPDAKTFFASSSEVFGEQSIDKLLGENSEKNPKTPYGVSKLTQNHLVRIYREKYAMKLFTGILFPHESPYRNPEFVTRKITRGFVSNKFNKIKTVQLGDLRMQRDWGDAEDFVKWMKLLLEKGNAGDYVFGTGKNTSVENFMQNVAQALDVELRVREGKVVNSSEYFDAETGEVWACSNPSSFNANRFSYGPADNRKLIEAIGSIEITTIAQLAEKMIRIESSRLVNN